jgi:hypothetical protein
VRKSDFIEFLSNQYSFIESLPTDPLKLNEIIADKYKMEVVADKKVSKILWEKQTETLNLIANIKMLINKQVSEEDFENFANAFSYLINAIERTIRGEFLTEQEIKDYINKMKLSVKNEMIEQLIKIYLKNKETLQKEIKKNVYVRILIKNLSNFIGGKNDSNNNN